MPFNQEEKYEIESNYDFFWSAFTAYLKAPIMMATCGQTIGKSHLTYAYIDQRTIKSH